MARISDVKLKKLVEEHKELKNKEAKIKEAASKRQALIIKELERRGVKAWEASDGSVRTTVTAQTRVEYHMDKLAEALTPRQLKLITTRVVDKDKLGSAVQEGKVPMATVERCAEVSKNAPYLRTTLRTPSE